jgi:VWFA-related protein
MKLAGLFSFLVLCTAPAAGAQEAQDPPAPVFRAGVELVRLDVRVVDGDGRPVRDITADEIEIFEEGQRREVVFFQRMIDPEAPYLEAAQRTIASEVSTNQGSPRGQLYVLVFDQHHITPGNEQRARMAAERFLRTQMRPGDRVALFGIPGPGPQLEFSSDVTRALAELRSVRGSGEQFGRGALGVMRLYEAYQIYRGNDEILSRVAVRATEQGGTDVFPVIPSTETAGTFTAGGESMQMIRGLMREDARSIVMRADESARQFLATFAEVIRILQAIEGRKTVILFSQGFYSDNVSREIEQVAAAAALSYSVIYSFDLNRRESDIREETTRGGEPSLEVQDRLEPLGSLAAETSGELVLDAVPQLDRALNLLADQSQDYYIVGFAPVREALRDRDRYRRVKVNVTRPGARLSTRTGYAMRSDRTPVDRRRAVNMALTAPFPQQALKVEYTTYVLRGQTPGLQRVVLSMAAELPVAGPNRVAGPNDERADVVFVVRSVTDGSTIASGSDTIPLPPTNHLGRLTGTTVYRVQFDAPPGEYLMRVVVREPGGTIGSADRRFSVRSLASPGVTAGDLILGSPYTSRLPVRAEAYADDLLTGVLELYSRWPAQLEDVTAHLELAPVLGDRSVRSVAGDLLDIREADAGASRPVQFELPLAGVDPGSYVARVVVRAGGETAGDLVRETTILPGPPPAAVVVTGRPEPTTDGDPRALLEGEIALDIARQILTRPAGEADVLREAARAAVAGRWDEIERRLEPIEGAEAAALTGLARYARGDYAGAADALGHALEIDARDARVAFLLGWARAAGGDHTAAIGAWRNAAYLDPSLVPAHLALADAYVRLAQPALALQAVRAGLTAMPQSSELLDMLARLDRR